MNEAVAILAEKNQVRRVRTRFWNRPRNYVVNMETASFPRDNLTTHPAMLTVAAGTL
jgi:hypothetical protein